MGSEKELARTEQTRSIKTRNALFGSERNPAKPGFTGQNGVFFRFSRKIAPNAKIFTQTIVLKTHNLFNSGRTLIIPVGLGKKITSRNRFALGGGKKSQKQAKNRPKTAKTRKTAKSAKNPDFRTHQIVPKPTHVKCIAV